MGGGGLMNPKESSFFKTLAVDDFFIQSWLKTWQPTLSSYSKVILCSENQLSTTRLVTH